MVQRVEYVMIDDLDGSEAAETVVFALDGQTYEVDLSTEHAAKLREDLKPWIAAGRRVKSGRGGRGGRGAKAPNGETAKIRDWARSQGMAVSDRGRIPLEIRAAYGEAH
ncbi:MAG: Lsr2 family protein [Bifidobacteriaceae bacterium]|jgi:hypothetical protein|nr:Lsr2 family protein [Bifidobacteriaceae bacterium]